MDDGWKLWGGNRPEIPSLLVFLPKHPCSLRGVTAVCNGWIGKVLWADRDIDSGW